MKPTPFDPERDIAPIPFEQRHCELAAGLKDAGLQWRPHVGCFVWDRDQHIAVNSPFPERIYFILNLGHFLRLLGTVEDVREKLVWLPTWHQARTLCASLGVTSDQIFALFTKQRPSNPGDELIALYQVLRDALQKA